MIRISERLRRILALRGQTIRAFSEQTGIPYRTLQDYLGDKGKPGADQLARMASAGIDLNLLITGRPANFALFESHDSAIPPADEDALMILADRDVLRAIDTKAKAAINKVLQDQIAERGDVSFVSLQAAYLQLVLVLASVFSRSEPPIADARKLGLSMDHVIDAVLGATASIALAKIIPKASP